MHFRPKARIAAIAVVILLLHSAAQQRARAQEPKPVSVSGVVKNRLTGQPIARALVDGQSDAMLTDSEGRFDLRLPAGYGQLMVRRPGYSMGQERGGTHRLHIEGDISGLVLYLTPTATITGHVAIPDGAETSGMSFLAYRRRTLNGHPQWQQAGFANTNPDGAFKMYDVESPGDYVLCNQMFQDRTSGLRQGKPPRGIASQCYPTDPGDGPDNLLHIVPGQQVEVEITRTVQPFYPVKIAMPNQPTGHGYAFQVYSQNGIPTGARMQGKDEGWTEVDLPNGSYYAEHRSWGKETSYGRVDFKVDNGGPRALTLVVLPLAQVLVQFHKDFTVRAEQQGPTTVVVNNDAPPAQVELWPADGMNAGGGQQPIHHVEGGPTDVFALDGITPGRYWVQATSFMEGYVSAITSGGVDLRREPLIIGPGNNVPPIEVTLRNDTGQIDCTVNGPTTRTIATNGFVISSGGEGPFVYAIPAGARASRFSRQNTVTGGTASFPNLAPGTYHVVALENYRDLELLDDQELALLEEKGGTVTVPAGGAVSVRVDLIKTDDEGPTP